jgi:hypothetical protein
MITTLYPSSAFVPVGQFQFPSSTFLDLYMTVKLPSLEISTTSWRKCMICMGQSVVLTWLLAM